MCSRGCRTWRWSRRARSSRWTISSPKRCWPTSIRSTLRRRRLTATSTPSKCLTTPDLLYYRRSILEEAGVAPPTTMDELIAAAQALDTGRVKGLFLGNDGGVNALHHIAGWSAGVDFLDPEAGQITFDNERTVLAYEKVKRAERHRRPARRLSHRLVGPLRLHPGSRRHAVDRALGDAGHHRRRSATISASFPGPPSMPTARRPPSGAAGPRW